MATYTLGPGTPSGFLPAILWRPLICEACTEALGTVRSFVRHEDISVRLVIALWPEMRKVVRRHEARCGSEAGR